MVIGERLKELRKQKQISQGDIEKRTGLLRCYISRVENGHTVPAIETLEKMARALEVPMYQLFYEGKKPSAPRILTDAVPKGWGRSGSEAKTFAKFRRLMSQANESDLKLLLFLAQKMSQKKKRSARASSS